MTTAFHLHFSLGPVQGFVVQARRTRDLWAGSFLLSRLALEAMWAVENEGGRVDLPAKLHEDPSWLALHASAAGRAPYRATLPNRFRAVFDEEARAVDAARAAAEAIHEWWTMLARTVREHFFERILTREQVDRWNVETETPDLFWEIMWVVVPAAPDSEDALGARKLWRGFRPLPALLQQGDRCTLMPDWPELSGHSRVTKAGKEKQTDFWNVLHEAFERKSGDGEGGRRLELRDGERLCATALVKRLFPRLPEDKLAKLVKWPPPEADATVPSGERLRLSYMPSTSYMAAVHWLKRAVGCAPESCPALYALVAEKSRALATAERQTGLTALDGIGDVRDLDGKLFFRETVLHGDDLPFDEKTRKDVAELLRQIYDSEDAAGEKLGPPSPYYAILRMDGDRMGRAIRANGAVAEALPLFARAARGLVEEQSGRLVYAGADDVLALLPLEGAIPAAIALKECFRLKMEKVAPNDPASISAGIVFAHESAPLRAALAESSRLLDEVAKEANGRASLAVSVFRIGGPALEWATTWCDDAGGDLVSRLQNLLVRCHADTRALGSNRLAHAMRDRLGPFFTLPGTPRRDLFRGSAIVDHEVVATLVRHAGGEALERVADDDL
ncbi:MAG: type III-B CRISPR-associated protein Cas10/Cmr2, partial [Geminicoccaceae bacterium]|nr:type III-B CRISPR-associated protein Cas10/Cmr2 [Geminicoccaceae bacterium]